MDFESPLDLVAVARRVDSHIWHSLPRMSLKGFVER